jgi:hypothetical protein
MGTIICFHRNLWILKSDNGGKGAREGMDTGNRQTPVIRELKAPVFLYLFTHDEYGTHTHTHTHAPTDEIICGLSSPMPYPSAQ